MINDSIDKNSTPNEFTAGKLVVITGIACAGKDAVMEELIKKLNNFRKVVTYTDRKPREGIEIHGVHHHFVTPEELDKIHLMGELIEDPVATGLSRKATPKKEIYKVIYEGHKLIWRIDPPTAVLIATGQFFSQKFTKMESEILQKVTKVINITASQETVIKRRLERDKENFNALNYQLRDEGDMKAIMEYGSHIHLTVENEDGKLEEVVDTIIQFISG